MRLLVKKISPVFRNHLLLLLLSCNLAAANAQAVFTKSGPFNENTVAELARNLAAKPYSEALKTEQSLQDLKYNEYQSVRFRPERAIWSEQDVAYRLQMFLGGFYFKNQVEIASVSAGQAKHIGFDPSLFTVDPPVSIDLPKTDIGFSGFRVHTQLNRPNVWDEFVLFQGASNFRAVGKGQEYGSSGRGLALKTGAPEGEEFPLFRAFWVERPRVNASVIKVHALLDSPSVTGAYQFIIRSGDEAVMDVKAVLFPRVEIQQLGLAPVASMYLFSPSSGKSVDDFRSRVHNADGLLIVNGKNERVWRPLANPNTLQISAFMDQAPVGFGLIQRERNFSNYQDIEARFEQRPSIWIEPQGDWGEGEVMLVEIPSESETNDNIVAFWRPHQSLLAGKSYTYAYRLRWGKEPPQRFSDLKVVSTRVGRNSIKKATTEERRFVIDYAADDEGAPLAESLPIATVNASTGKIKNLTILHHRAIKGYRVSFEFEPKGVELSELRLSLKLPESGAAETWLYRWAPK